jgi:hypothetical protein
VRLFVTSAPADSKLQKAITDSAAQRVELHEGDVATPFDFTPDAGGVFTFLAQEIQTPTFPGAFQGDTRGYIDTGGGTLGTEKILNETAGITLYVGTRISFAIGAQPDTATLVFWVWNDTIRATTTAVQGETSPAVINPKTPRSKAAANSQTVRDAVALLADMAAGTARGSDATLSALVVDIWNKTMGHYTNGTAHPHTDTYNQLGVSFLPNGMSPDAVSLFLNQALTSLRRHYTNDKDGTGPGSASGIEFHVSGLSDLVNATLFRGVGAAPDQLNALADIVRSYEAHRIDTTVHNSADNTNTISATIPQLITIIRDFMTVVAASTPTAAVGDSSGASLFKAWGAKEG